MVMVMVLCPSFASVLFYLGVTISPHGCVGYFQRRFVIYQSKNMNNNSRIGVEGHEEGIKGIAFFESCERGGGC